MACPVEAEPALDLMAQSQCNRIQQEGMTSACEYAGNTAGDAHILRPASSGGVPGTGSAAAKDRKAGGAVRRRARDSASATDASISMGFGGQSNSDASGTGSFLSATPASELSKSNGTIPSIVLPSLPVQASAQVGPAPRAAVGNGRARVGATEQSGAAAAAAAAASSPQ